MVKRLRRITLRDAALVRSPGEEGVLAVYGIGTNPATLGISIVTDL